jgi:integrase
MRATNKLSALAVQRQKTPGRYGDGGGLWLQVSESGGKSWIFRFMHDGKARHMGIGPLEMVSLAEARELARGHRRLLFEGLDPIEARAANRQAAKATAARARTFKDCAEAFMSAHAAGWRNPKHAAQWRATLTTYAYPVIGEVSITAIDTAMVMKVIEAIWTTKAETASRVRGRIESVLDWATARSFRSGENPARWRGHLDHLLPARGKVARVRHHRALPYPELPRFMAQLRAQNCLSARALEFTILTAARTGEVIGATWAEVNFSDRVWIIPSERMKAGKAHRVPLSCSAVRILEALPRERDNNFVFIGAVANRPLSNMAMLELLRGLQSAPGDAAKGVAPTSPAGAAREALTAAPAFTVHGFRSTFRDWAAERTSHSHEAVEMALAHTVSDKVEAAYRRGDMFEKRRALIDDWEAFCEGADK